jgi:toxin ParE1/3/4
VKLALTTQAIYDLRGISDYISRSNPKAAVALLKNLSARFRQLCESPRLGKKRDDLFEGLRSSRIKEYLIFYTIEQDAIIIVHVLHGRRDLFSIFADEEM